MEFINPALTLYVTPEDLSAYLRGPALNAGPLTLPTLYLPVESVLVFDIDFTKMETKWSDTNMQGLRIANFNGTGLRVLTRQDDRILHSEVIDHNLHSRIIHSFYQCLYRGISDLPALASTQVSGDLCYTKASVMSLLIDSFCLMKKPRLIPSVVWPSDQKCLEVMTEYAPVGWKHSDHNGQGFLKKEGDQYLAQVLGERGDVEFSAENASLDVVLLGLLNHRVRRRYWDDDRNFIFDYLYP
jgi:hypothetical protein